MRQRISTTIITVILCLAVLSGCEYTKKFDAKDYVDSCTQFVDVDSYAGAWYELNILFVDTCLDRFVRSQYYDDMNETERLEAVKQIFEVLKTYSLPPLEDGLVKNVKYDDNTREFTWNYSYRVDYTGRWIMPS